MTSPVNDGLSFELPFCIWFFLAAATAFNVCGQNSPHDMHCTLRVSGFERTYTTLSSCENRQQLKIAAGAEQREEVQEWCDGGCLLSFSAAGLLGASPSRMHADDDNDDVRRWHGDSLGESNTQPPVVQF
jgi:hypothetical protein